MGTDLNAPLGQNRRSSDAKVRGRYGVRAAIAGTTALTVLGLSAWLFMQPDGLRKPIGDTEVATKTEMDALPDPATEKKGAETTAGDTPVVRRQDALSGARVQETLTSDGNVVTTYSPRPRGEGGPVVIGTQASVGQDPRMAATPNDNLLEDTPYGRLPTTGPDGLRPMDQYARPWSGARGTRIALVVGGLGLSQTGTQKAIRDLPEEVTLAFAASGNSLQRWMQEARRDGHEILLQIPFEPFDYPANDPGPDTLRVSVGAEKNLKALHESMARITNYTGVMNFLGGRFLSDADALEPVMRDLSSRGLLFLDDGTSAQSVTGTLASTLSVPHAFADLVLDTQIDKKSVLTKLDDLERIARRNGTAIGVASAFDDSVAAISEWIEEAAGRGIEIVGVSAIADDQKTR